MVQFKRYKRFRAIRHSIGKLLQAVGISLAGLGIFVSIGQGGDEKLLLYYTLAGMVPFGVGWLLTDR